MATIDMFQMPKDLFYSKAHTWVRVEDGCARIGFDDFFQKLAGGIVYIELPSVGETIRQMEPIAIVSSTNQQANRAFIGPPKEFRFDFPTLRNLAIRGGYCHCALGERCPCPRYRKANECPCQNYIPLNYLVAPISGVIREVNTALKENPWNVNMDPYGEGWILMVEPTDLEGELKQLVTSDALSDWLRKEIDAKGDLVKGFKQQWDEVSSKI